MERYGYKAWCITPDACEEMGPTDESVYPSIQWICDGVGVRKEFAERQFGEYFGNEACGATFYTSAAVVIHVPEASERAELRALSLDSKRLAPPKETPAAAAKRKKEAESSVHSTRRIHIQGGQGGLAKKTVVDGKPGVSTVILPPGAGLRDLKKVIRKRFGRYPSHRLGALYHVDENKKCTSRAVKGDELKDGITISCSYVYAEGNAANLPRRAGFMWGFGF